MLVRRKKGWELSEAAATPEDYYIDRRRLLAGMGMGALILAAPATLQHIEAGPHAASGVRRRPSAGVDEPSEELYPAPRNVRYQVDRPITAEKYATTYNNFYEFGSHKEIYHAAQAMRVRPWEVSIDGLVDREMTVDIDQLLRRMPLEERVYRHRCVEGWSMVIPWVGFPLAEVIKRAEPLGSAKFVAFETLVRPSEMPGQHGLFQVLAWPYVEGVRLDEAMHPLTILAVGVYDETLPNQNGAPLRLVVPWKYGFKGIKSIVRISLVEEAPLNTWQAQNSSEYGFYSNVNPEVDHPRWSQKTERRIGDGLLAKRRPTLPFNGYGDQVASLYAGMDLRRYF